MRQFQCTILIDRCYDDSSGQSDDYLNETTIVFVKATTLEGLYRQLASYKRQEITKPGFGTIHINVKFGPIEEVEIISEQKVFMEDLLKTDVWQSFVKELEVKAEREKREKEKENKMMQDRKEQRERSEFERLQKKFGEKK